MNRKFSVIYLATAAIIGSLVSIAIIKGIEKYSKSAETTTAATDGDDENEFTISRLGGYKYIHPVYLAEPKNESNNFIALETEITDYIDHMKVAGDLDNASVYLKDLTTNDWMDVYPENAYHPGSLFKVITMITFLKMAETNISFMEKEVLFKKDGKNPPTQTYNSKMLEDGHTYKIRELIYYMIAYSDNNATMALHDYVNIDLFQKIFADLNLPKPNVFDNSYRVSVKDYSKFFNVLYDGGYLTIPASEFAISLLCESDFNLGITKELPATVKVAHKFGEAGKPGNREFHESGIIYLNNKPYLLTVMTQGKESSKLAELIGHISKMAYTHMSSLPV